MVEVEAVVGNVEFDEGAVDENLYESEPQDVVDSVLMMMEVVALQKNTLIAGDGVVAEWMLLIVQTMFVVGIAGSNKEPCEEQALACLEEVLVCDDEEPDVFVDSDIDVSELAEPFLPQLVVVVGDELGNYCSLAFDCQDVWRFVERGGKVFVGLADCQERKNGSALA